MTRCLTRSAPRHATVLPSHYGIGKIWAADASYTIVAPVFTSLALSGTNFIIAGTNGTASATCYLLASTNVVLPLTNWTRLATNALDAQGNLAVTNGVSPQQPRQFYRRQMR